MNYNPKIHNRKSIRLKGYNYACSGLYFITVCCEHKKNRFGEIENDEMVLNDFGKMAYDEWLKLTERFTHIELDVFQIMPNHIHGIIGIKHVIGSEFQSEQFEIEKLVLAQPQGLPLQPPQESTNKTINDIVGAYKSLVANKCLAMAKLKNETLGKLWQRNYYEHIIRDEKGYQNISNYIINNPLNWPDDNYFNK